MKLSDDGLKSAGDNLGVGIMFGLIIGLWVGGCQIKYGLQEVGKTSANTCTCRDR